MPVPWSSVLGRNFMTHEFLLLLNDVMAEECRVFLHFHYFLTLQFEEQKIKLNPFFFKCRVAGCMQLSWDKRSKLFLSMTWPTLCLASTPSVEDWPMTTQPKAPGDFPVFCCWQHRRMYDRLHKNVSFISTCEEACHTKDGSNDKRPDVMLGCRHGNEGFPFPWPLSPVSWAMIEMVPHSLRNKSHHTVRTLQKRSLTPGTLGFCSLGQRVYFLFVVIYS